MIGMRNRVRKQRSLRLGKEVIQLVYPPVLESLMGTSFGSVRLSRANPKRRVTVSAAKNQCFNIKGGKNSRSGLSAAELPAALMEDVVHALIVDMRDYVALHAGAVAYDGIAALFIGPTGAGKSSLAAWFVSKGFSYLTDELVVLRRGRVLGFPRGLVIKGAVRDQIASLPPFDLASTIRGETSCVLGAEAVADDKVARPCRLIVFPRFVPGSELSISATTPGRAALRLMECNLNAGNLRDGGFGAVAALARDSACFELQYGNFSQLDGVADVLARIILDGHLDSKALPRLLAGLQPTRQAAVQPQPPPPAPPVVEIPAPTPRRGKVKLTIGMATYDDYDGVYFSVQALRMYHQDVADTEILVIDNNPEGRAAHALKSLENEARNFRYVPSNAWSGTAIRDQIFHEADGRFVLCIDCHVFIVPGALRRLVAYLDEYPDTKDLLQGPILFDNLQSIATHFHPEWRSGMYGYWDLNPLGVDPDAEPFEIPMQGLGLFASRRDIWPGFHPDFRGFGGEEGYIHEKFRRAGNRTLCLPFLRWMHRFNRPSGVPYAPTWEDRVRNYVIGHREFGIPTDALEAHFTELIGETHFKSYFERVMSELSED